MKKILKKMIVATKTGALMIAASIALLSAIAIATVGVVLKSGAVATGVLSTLLVDGIAPARRIARQFKEIRLF